ncbi:MAG TPA: RdgB/HAM1 family non-canonical purine NTP pyrophosphatase [Candidatus Omnitrophota bacterium]|nr:RdgB/HAM1 family non-canonical purine NTP pyrophosphatase [Candidatus Omnitrophota bacterium]HPS20511.1 RdgB/HAM1 family non-canonical purine NTP pyrophosphatase [Candidatus Omnitrophota bacterium]
MTKLLVATFNKKKRAEIRSLLKTFKGIRVMNLEDIRLAPPMIIEDGKTFRENAVKKALTMSRFFDGLVIADDSGLEVEALGGKPGVRSARFSRKNATDEENNAKLLSLLDNIPDEHRAARFVCHIALAKQGKLLDSFEGVVDGKVLSIPQGANGFGYDPLFVPKKHEETFAEMSDDEKNKISHRAMALKKLKKVIKKYLD